MNNQAGKAMAKALLHSAVSGPDRLVDVDIGRALGWRVSQDPWWNHRGNRDDGSPIYDPPGDDWCIRRDARSDVPCNEALPTFTFIPRRDAEAIIDQEDDRA